MSYRDAIDRDTRLIILRTLAGEIDRSLNEKMLVKELETFGYTKTREYVRTQLRWLESQAGAVTVREAGTVLIGTITRAGINHLERRIELEGVDQPSDEV